jgi:hypothetical protein
VTGIVERRTRLPPHARRIATLTMLRVRHSGDRDHSASEIASRLGATSCTAPRHSFLAVFHAWSEYRVAHRSDGPQRPLLPARSVQSLVRAPRRRSKSRRRLARCPMSASSASGVHTERDSAGRPDRSPRLPPGAVRPAIAGAVRNARPAQRRPPPEAYQGREATRRKLGISALRSALPPWPTRASQSFRAPSQQRRCPVIHPWPPSVDSHVTCAPTVNVSTMQLRMCFSAGWQGLRSLRPRARANLLTEARQYPWAVPVAARHALIGRRSATAALGATCLQRPGAVQFCCLAGWETIFGSCFQGPR